MVSRINYWVPLSHIVMTHCLYLMALCGLRVGWTSFIVGTSGFSVWVVVNVFCTCKPLGGAGVFCLVPKVTSFHHSSSEFACFNNGHNTIGVFHAARVTGFSSNNREDPVYLYFFFSEHCAACFLPLGHLSA